MGHFTHVKETSGSHNKKKQKKQNSKPKEKTKTFYDNINIIHFLTSIFHVLHPKFTWPTF